MDNETKYGYMEELKIDFATLELDWIQHPSRYMKWGELHVQAVAKRDRKKEEVDLKSSLLDKDIRTQPDKYEISSIKEAAVTAAIKSDKGYKALAGELISLNEEVNVLAVAKTAFEHRKKALEGLTQLYCAGYFAKPNIPEKAQEDLGGQMRKAQQEGLLEGDRTKKKLPTKKLINRSE